MNRRAALRNAVILKKRRLPLNSRIVFLGDSITNYSGLRSHREWVRSFCPGYFMLRSGNQGVSNDKTDQIQARLSATTGQSPKVVVCLFGTNDLAQSAATTYSLANIQTRTRAIYDTLIAAGAKVVAIPVLRRSDAFTRESDRVALNDYIKAQACKDIIIADCEAFNPATQSTDGLHPDPVGALVIADVITPILNRLIAPGSPLLEAADPLNLAINPSLDGAVSSNGGEIASNYTLTVPAAMSGKIVPSKGTLSDGTPAQVFTLSSVPASQTTVTFISDAITITGINGDKFEVSCAYELNGVAGLLAFSLDAESGNYSLAFFTGTEAVVLGATGKGLVTRKGVLRGSPIALSGGADATTTIRFQMIFHNNGGDLQGGALAGTIKLGKMGLRRVNSL